MDITSVLDAVTVHRREAVCVRRARIGAASPAPALPGRVRFVGLPLALEPGSVRARVVEGPPGLRVLDVRAELEVVLGEEIDVPAEARALEAAEEERARLDTALVRIESEIAELEQLRAKPHEQRRGDPPRESAVAAVIALSEFVEQRLVQRLARRRELHRQREATDEAVVLRQRRLQEASSALSSTRTRVRRAVVATLSDAVAGPIELAIEYVVPGARWAPSYELRLDPGLAGGELFMRAAIAQATGEDWTGVALSLSTASLSRSADVPVLKLLKIGRTQPAPPRSGWREPPPGLDDLFEGYDDVLRLRPSQRPLLSPRRPGRPVAAGLAAAASAAPRGGRPSKARPERAAYAVAAAAPPAMMAPAPMAMRRMARARVGGDDDGVGDEFEPPAEEGADADRSAEEAKVVSPPAPAGPDERLLDYDRLAMARADEVGARGRLRAASRDRAAELALHAAVAVKVEVEVLVSLVDVARQAAACIGELPLPPRCLDPAPLDHFDYRTDCAHRVDVPSTGAWVTVPAAHCVVGLSPEYVVVPAVDLQVFRTVQIRNGSPQALLPGPVDVSVGDQFLLTASLPALPPGAEGRRLGLGVEEAIKVARRAQFRETHGGLLGGTTLAIHDLEIEINNRLASAAAIEVRERVPVADPSEKDLEVEETPGKPAWETVEQAADGDGVPVAGLRRWRVTVAGGARINLTARYALRMPSDKMLVGGNRRT